MFAYVILHIIKGITKNGNEVKVTCITSDRGFIFNRDFVYRRHLTCNACEHDQTSLITEEDVSTNLQSIVITMVLCMSLIHRRLSMHSKRGHPP